MQYKIYLATKRAQIVVVIMGGDGTLGNLVRGLRKNEVINKYMDKLHFCLLPYGTGNDTAQVFGWGGNYIENLFIYIQLLSVPGVKTLML